MKNILICEKLIRTSLLLVLIMCMNNVLFAQIQNGGFVNGTNHWTVLGSNSRDGSVQTAISLISPTLNMPHHYTINGSQDQLLPRDPAYLDGRQLALPGPANTSYIKLESNIELYNSVGSTKILPHLRETGVINELNPVLNAGQSFVVTFWAFVISRRNDPNDASIQVEPFLLSPYGEISVHLIGQNGSIKTPAFTKRIPAAEFEQIPNLLMTPPTPDKLWKKISFVVTIPPGYPGTSFDKIAIRATGNHLRSELVNDLNGGYRDCLHFEDEIYIDDFEIKPAPEVKFTKTITKIDQVPVTPGSPVVVYADQDVEYTITAEVISGTVKYLEFTDDISNTALTSPVLLGSNATFDPITNIITCIYNNPTGVLTQGNTTSWTFTARVKPGVEGITIRNCISKVIVKNHDDEPGLAHASSQFCADIPVIFNCTANAGSNVAICQGSSIQLQATGGHTYSWSPATGLSDPNIANPVAAPSQDITYTVTVYKPGCASTSDVTVFVIPNTASVSSNVTICQGSSTQLQTDGGPGYSYSWSPTAGLDDPTAQYPVATPGQSTTYTVTVTNPSNCTSSASVTVTVVPACISVGHDITVVQGSPAFYLTGVSPEGGTWSGKGLRGQGLFDPTAHKPGVYLLTYTVNNSCGTLSATINVTIVEDDSSGPSSNFVCTKDYYVNDNETFGHYELGSPGVETTINANDYGGEVIFDGVYHVLGSLRLEEGTFRMKPGTIFYVDPICHKPTYPVEEYLRVRATYILLNGARLEMEGAAMRGTCEMWGGVILNNGSVIKAGTSFLDPNPDYPDVCVKLKNEISDAFVGILASTNTENGRHDIINDPIVNENEYYIDNTNFFNNYIGFMDAEKERPVLGEGVIYSLFQTYPERMMAPLDSITPTTRWYGYQGMKLRGWNFEGIAFEHNTFDNLCEGLNMEGTKLTLRHNSFTRNYQYGIRIRSHIGYQFGTGPDEITVENNTIVVPAEEVITEDQVNPNSPVMGIFTNSDYNVHLKILRNTITGSDSNPRATSKIQYGIYNDMSTYLSLTVADNDIRHQNTGIRMVHTNNSNLVPVYRQNYLGSNDVAIGVGRNLLSNARAQISCNTIANPVGIAGPRGIRIEPGAWLGNLGTDANPNGNKFVGINEGMINDANGFFNGSTYFGNTNFEYYRHNSSEESWGLGGNPTVHGNPGGSVIPSSVSNLNYCQLAFNNTSNNGVNARVQGTSYAAILEMMDSLQMQVGTPADLMHYQSQILEYHKQRNLLASLEQFMYLLPGQNLQAYNFFALALMEHYRKENQEPQAQALRADLLAYNPLSHDIKFRVKYFDVMGRLGKHTTLPGYRFTVADSLDLSDISWSNTSHSEVACINLRFYRPKAACGTSSSNAQSRIANVVKPKAVKGNLGQSYPNPAALEATIPYEVNPGVKEAELRIYEIATGRIIQIVRLDVKAQYVNLDLKPIRQGVYSYTLFEDGMPTATKKMVVLK